MLHLGKISLPQSMGSIYTCRCRDEYGVAIEGEAHQAAIDKQIKNSSLLWFSIVIHITLLQCVFHR
jgi:hypothetical protein